MKTFEAGFAGQFLQYRLDCLYSVYVQSVFQHNCQEDSNNFPLPRSKLVMDPVRDELLLTDDHEETDDYESDETDDVSRGWLYILTNQGVVLAVGKNKWTFWDVDV